MTDEPTDGGPADESSSRSLEVSYTLGDDESPSTSVVKATALLTDTSPLDLDPLYDVIDPEHLDGMVRSSSDDPGSVEISFRYSGCEVTVTPAAVHLRNVRDET